MLLISIYFQTLFSMLDHNITEFFAKDLHENKVQFPEERNAFVLDDQHGRRDVTRNQQYWALSESHVVNIVAVYMIMSIDRLCP